VSDGKSCVPDARSIRLCVGNFGGLYRTRSTSFWPDKVD